MSDTSTASREISISSIKGLLDDASNRLTPHHDSARLDAELLLAHTIKQPRSHLHAWPEQELSDSHINEFNDLVTARHDGVPIAYLTAHREFWSMDLLISEATLIPRPETELLVERALQHIENDADTRVADMGTGSGAIALALGKERPLIQITATDISNKALFIARRNMQRLGINNIRLHTGSWLDQHNPFKYDVLVSNPPYICSDDPHLQQGDVRFEPATALASGVDGLDSIREIITLSSKHLKPGGWLLLEHGYNQATQVGELLLQAGFTDIATSKDINQIDRVTEARLPA